MAQNGVDLHDNRRVRIVELKLRGYSNAQISEQLRAEGFGKSSERSVNRVWAEARSSVVEYRPWTGEMIDELLRHQLAEITIVDERSLKLKYRDRLLDKLMPRQTQPIAITGPVAPIFDLGLKDVGSKPPDTTSPIEDSCHSTSSAYGTSGGRSSGEPPQGRRRPGPLRALRGR